MVFVKGRCAVSNLTNNAGHHPSRVRPNGSRFPSRPARRKALGQHFLNDGRIVGRILAASDIQPDDLVLEIGPGLGVLTRKLVQLAGNVVAVEMDGELADSLPSRLDYPPNLHVVQGDARTIDFNPLLGDGASYKVVANLPYYAANPIVRRFLEAAKPPELLVVMVQKEVAESMLAGPGGMTMLSVATQFYATPSLVCNVPPRSFRPPPAVRSAVVRLDVRPSPAVAVRDPAAFFDLVRAGFSAPRKQLRNSLSHGLGERPALIAQLLADLELDGSRRAETLILDEWALIYRRWEETGKVGITGVR